MAYIRVKEANCKNCYKCLKHCSVKSISYINDRVEVLADGCILCGHCINVCPQGAKTVVNDPARILGWLTDKQHTRVVASVAPSYIGVYKVEHREALYNALTALGFDAVEETAVGAQEVTAAYRELMRDGRMPVILTTCCPTVNMLITKYYPELIDYMAPVVSPVLAHGHRIKQRDGENTRVVFIGPCLSKIKEIDDHPEFADGVLSFRQLDDLLRDRGMTIETTDLSQQAAADGEAPFSGLYPIPDGIVRDVQHQSQEDVGLRTCNGYHTMSVSGLDNVMACLQELQKDKREGRVRRLFIELNACDGGCVNGPLIPAERRSLCHARFEVENYVLAPAQTRLSTPPTPAPSCAFAADDYTQEEPDEQTIRKILTEIGKPTPDKELNCGSCGYATCRDKAIAVYRKKAELYMCLPYMAELAQSLSGVTLSVTPNYVIAVDRDLRIVEFNPAAQKRFGISRSEALKADLYELMDPADFLEVFETRSGITDKKISLSDKQEIILETLVYAPGQDLVIGFFKDVTQEERQREELYKARLEAAEMTQKVIEKQMIAAQEIASLLGETTAETKVTLNNLKKQILSEAER